MESSRTVRREFEQVIKESRGFCRIPKHLDSEGRHPSGSCDPDCELGSGRPHWIVKERLGQLDCSEEHLGS